MKIVGMIAVAAGLLMPTWEVAAEKSAAERGAYMVNALMICGRCHTMPGPQAKPFAGGRVIETSHYKVQGSNITPDVETGIGGWSDAEIGRAITEGVRPDGSRMSSSMPYGFYAGLTPTDLAAVVAYLRSLAPVKNAVAAPVYFTPPAPAAANMAASVNALSASATRGGYLGTLARCLGCHSAPGPDGEPDLHSGLGRGGMSFEGPWGVVTAPDITPRGLAGWTDGDIRQALVEGVTPEGQKLAAPMQAKAYAQLTEEDIAALVAWLRTLPAGR